MRRRIATSWIATAGGVGQQSGRLRALRGVIAALVLCVMCAPSAGAASVAEIPGDASVLFTLEAREGSFVPQGTDRFRLSLRGLGPQSTWFADRPRRDAGRVSTRSLLQSWRKLGFTATPPNGAVVLDGGRSASDTVAVELRLRHFDARRRTARFDVRVLDGLGPGLRHLNRRLDARLPRRFGGASVFLDNGTPYGDCIIGQPQLFAFTRPAGTGEENTWVPASGQLLDPYVQMALIGVYGNRFGGDGQTTWRAPNLPPPLPGMSWQICAQGDFPNLASMPCTTGELDLWALPSGSPPSAVDPRWLPADGRTVARADYPVFAAGYGIGASQTTFALPDLPAPPGFVYLACVDGYDPAQATPVYGTVGQIDLLASHDGIGLPSARVESGQTLGVEPYVVLYQVLGATFGGDGDTTFGTPVLLPPEPGLLYAITTMGIFPG
jgi:microcystin-dependent protein